MILLLTFFLTIYLIVFVGTRILRYKLRKFQREAEERANQGRTQYADGQIIYQKDGAHRKHFSQTDGEYVDYEEVE